MAKQETPILDAFMLAVLLLVAAAFITTLAVIISAFFIVAATVCFALVPVFIIVKAWRIAPFLTIIAAIVALLIYLHLR